MLIDTQQVYSYMATLVVKLPTSSMVFSTDTLPNPLPQYHPSCPDLL